MHFNEKEYIQSDLLEQYCLGLLSPAEAGEVERLASTYPAIGQELDRLTQTMADYALSEPILPSAGLKSRVMMALTQLGDPPAFDLSALPLINAYSDARQWQRTVASIPTPATYENVFNYVLHQDERVEQCLVWVQESVDPEEHHDELESFLLLEGCCECTVGDKLVQLSAGDYFEVPLGLEHSVRVLSETPVKAILQHLKVAA